MFSRPVLGKLPRHAIARARYEQDLFARARVEVHVDERLLYSSPACAAVSPCASRKALSSMIPGKGRLPMRFFTIAGVMFGRPVKKLRLRRDIRIDQPAAHLSADRSYPSRLPRQPLRRQPKTPIGSCSCCAPLLTASHLRRRAERRMARRTPGRAGPIVPWLPAPVQEEPSHGSPS